nr:autotransporter domain-containing protein [Bradyrhizobium tropiciagri]
MTGGVGGAGGNGGSQGAGGGGGEGGFALIVNSAAGALPANSAATGGTGGAGGSSGTAFGPGGGGDGGVGVYITGGPSGQTSISNLNLVNGGLGGAGGAGTGVSSFGGAGGAGGSGLVISVPGSYALSTLSTARFTAGDGGAGGSSPSGVGGNGGAGGAGLFVRVFFNSGTYYTNYINNAATIIGGSGGAAGSGLTNGAAGAGGAGVTGSFISLINSGAITGGLSGDGSTRADALAFTGGSNTLTTNAGASYTGNISISNANSGTLSLLQTTGGGATGSATYSNAITGSGSLIVTTDSGYSVTLSGANSFSGGTTVNSGSTLNLSSNTGAGTGNVALQVGSTLGLNNVAITNTVSGSGDPDITVAGASSMPTFTGAAGTTFNVLGTGNSAATDLLTVTTANATYAGTTNIGGTASGSAVTLKGGASNAFGSASAVSVFAGSVLDLGGFNQTIASLSGGGTVTNGGASGGNTLAIGGGTASTFSGHIIDGSTATVALSLSNSGTSLTLSGANTYSGATSINNGTLALSGTGSIATSSAVNLATGTTFDISQTNSGASIATLGNTAAGQTGTVSLGSKTLTITGGSGTFDGIIADGGINNTTGGSLFISGGALTLNGANTYTGLTTVASGATLTVGDSEPHDLATIAGDVSVKGGTLAGYGAIQGSVTLSNGGVLMPGVASQLGSITIGGSLSIGDGSRLVFDFGAPGPNFTTPGQSDHVVVHDNLSIGSSTLVVNNLGSMGPGLYELFSWGSSLDITGGGFAPPAGTSLQILTVDRQINLIDAQNLTLSIWDGNGQASVGHLGGGSGTWSLFSNTWSDTTGQFVGSMSPQPGFAIFGGPSGTVTVDNSQGAVSATGMQFVTDGYHLVGGALTLVGQGSMPVVRVGAGATATIDNVIQGTAGLNKTDFGTLVLTGTNQYSGGTVISGGRLSVSSNANLGDSSGGLTLNGGILQVTGTSFSSTTRAITLGSNGGGFDIANAANTFTVNQQLSGSGGLAKLGAGTLALTGANSYSGATTVSDGTLVIGNGGAITNSSSLTNSANVLVDAGGSATFGSVTNAATGVITVAAGGTVHDDLNNAGTVTNNGAYFANVASNSGSITNNGTWTGTIATAGTFINDAGATVSGLVTNSGTASNAGTLNGGLTNTGGTFNNTGAINGTTTISGGALLGTGSIGNLAVGNGAVFAPGNGTPGTSMTVNGSLAFSSGAFYQIALNPQTATFVTASGAATLGGASVQAFFSSGSYVAKQYTIVSAAGGIGGSFNALANTNLPSGFTSSLSYDATHAYLDLALNFAPPTALTVNQRNVSNALINSFNTLGRVPIVFGALTPSGLTQASGESATASQQTTFDAMNLFMGVMTDPFVAGRGDAAGAGGTPNAYAADSLAYAAKGRSPDDRSAYAAMYTKAPVQPTFEQRWSVWAAGFGGSQTTSGDPVVGSNNTTSSIYGTAVGADYRFSPDTLAGFALAGGGTNFNVNGLGYGRSDLFQAGAFIRHNFGPAYITGALAYGWQDVTTDRIVTAAGIDHLRAEFNANAWSSRVESGYRFVVPAFGGLGLAPYAAGQFTAFDLPAYTESVVTGTPNFALAYAAKSVTDARSEVGIRTDKSFAMTDGVLMLRTRFAWAHEFDPDRSIATTFQSLPGASFVVNGAAQASDSALTTVSAEMRWTSNWSAAVTFEGEFSNITSSYAGKGVVRYAW